MALTTEQLVLQVDILASKTDSTTNPNMTFKTNGTLNKALNPTYFTGNNTKIVNAINLLATNGDVATTTANKVLDKVNNILLDVDTTSGSEIWLQLQGLMGKETIVEGMTEILIGNKIKEILGIASEDAGKLLIVDQDEEGKTIISTIEVAGLGEAIKAEEVVYSNPDRPEFPTVQSAVDYILNNEGNFGGGSGNNEPIVINWDEILGKPAIPTGLSLTETQLCLNSEEENMSAVELMTDQDIDFIIQAL